MKTEIIAGDTLAFSVDFPDYPANGGWTLTYKLAPRSGTVLSFDATASGSTYSISVPAATTSAWLAGTYAWSAYVTKASERYTVDQGYTRVKLNPITAGDRRSHARKVLEAIEAVLEGRAAKDQMAYTINGRELHRTPIPDLLTLRSQYRSEVRAEDQADRVAAGLPDRRRMYIRTLRA